MISWESNIWVHKNREWSSVSFHTHGPQTFLAHKATKAVYPFWKIRNIWVMWGVAYQERQKKLSLIKLSPSGNYEGIRDISRSFRIAAPKWIFFSFRFYFKTNMSNSQSLQTPKLSQGLSTEWGVWTIYLSWQLIFP